MMPEQALAGSLRDYRVLPGTDLVARVEPFYQWQNVRRQFDLWPYAKSTATAPRTRCTALTDTGKLLSGVNFASQDYLSLASHPDVKCAAIRAIEEYGVHSAGSAALLGNTKHSLELERTITEFLHGRATVLYPTAGRRALPPCRASSVPTIMWSWMCWPTRACRKALALPHRTSTFMGT